MPAASRDLADEWRLERRRRLRQADAIDAAYRLRPLDWAVERLGVSRESLQWSLYPEYASHQWDGTPDPLARLLDCLARGQDVGVESGTGTGKSYTCALAVLWFLACWPDARVFTFAPKEDQLRLYIWAEIGRLWPRFRQRFPDAVLTDLTIRMASGDTWGAWGYSVAVRAGEAVAVNAAGMHAAHMLLLNEETPGISPAVLEAQRNTATGAHNLRASVGNPDNRYDALHQFCLEPGVEHIRISALDYPNVVLGREVVPGAVTRQSVERRLAQYGADSSLAQSRIRGISPTESAESLILSAWIDAALARGADAAFRRGPMALGVDVANSEAGDEAAIARGVGACLDEVVSFPCPDANLLGARVVAEARVAAVEPARVGVDSVGVGAGTVNEAKRLGFRVAALNGGERAWNTLDDTLDVDAGARPVLNVERFQNLRSQMWWQLRMDLQHGRLAFRSCSDELRRDLLTPTWATKDGKIVVESKESIKKRLPGGRSPNQGDAVCYWNWVRSHDAVVEPEPDYRAFSSEALAADADRRRIFQHRQKRRRQRPTPDDLI